VRIALAQLNQIVGDLDGNRDRILGALAEARDGGAQLVVFPELAVTGYPPEDLLLRPGFLRAAERTLATIAAEARGVVALVGTPLYEGDLFNACALCADGEVKAYARKRFLPNYGVFDEHRYFAAGREPLLFELDGSLVGVTICEDMWQPGPPASELALAGAELLVNVSASPFHVGRERMREQMFRSRARDYVSMVAFCNLVGGQDELIFDGHSVVIDDEGEVLARATGFEEELLLVDLDPQAVIGRRLTDVRRRSLAEEQPAPALTPVAVSAGPVPAGHVEPRVAEFTEELESMRQALVLGLRDYVA
jgi:NAD+ synthase (glutamine-hydrolysing)